MHVPLFHDYPLPAQHAAAAAQHPMLAPRPLDVTTYDDQHYLPVQTVPPTGNVQPANESPFHYPGPPVQVTPWPRQPEHIGARRRMHSATTSDSDLQSSANGSDQSSTPYKPDAPTLKVEGDVDPYQAPAHGTGSTFAPRNSDSTSEEKTSATRVSISIFRLWRIKTLIQIVDTPPFRCIVLPSTTIPAATILPADGWTIRAVSTASHVC